MMKTMNTRLISTLSAFALCAGAMHANAQVQIAPIFKDNMVLQQQTDAPIWGRALPGHTISVTVSWQENAIETKVSKDSTWRLVIPTPVASYDPQQITVSADGRSRTFSNVLIGEVWLCSGQSNMEMPMKGYSSQPILGGQDAIVHSKNDFLRCFTVGKAMTLQEQESCTGRWESASPNTTAEFTATGYYFARLLQEVLDVPVGIIHSSAGGSAIEAWIPREAFTREFPKIAIPNDISREKKKVLVPTVLYNAMIHPIAGYAIRGAIWYQGEANVGRYQEYPRMFAAMHDAWTKRWGGKRFPIYLCQIAPFRFSDQAGNAFLREAQMKIAQTQPDTGIAILMDTGEQNCIHPANKQVAGERLAYIALARNYGFPNLPYRAPEFRRAEYADGKATLIFDHTGSGFTSFGQPLTGFELAGADRVFHPATAAIVNGKIVVESSQVPDPVAVRYAFKGYIRGSLYGSNGLPVSSFRSDNWDDVR